MNHPHIVNTQRLQRGEFVSRFPQPETPPTRWQRVKRAVRTWIVDLALRA